MSFPLVDLATGAVRSASQLAYAVGDPWRREARERENAERKHQEAERARIARETRESEDRTRDGYLQALSLTPKLSEETAVTVRKNDDNTALNTIRVDTNRGGIAQDTIRAAGGETRLTLDANARNQLRLEEGRGLIDERRLQQQVAGLQKLIETTGGDTRATTSLYVGGDHLNPLSRQVIDATRYDNDQNRALAKYMFDRTRKSPLSQFTEALAPVVQAGILASAVLGG